MLGLKIRVQESKIWIEFMKALGAVATPIPLGELYSSAATKGDGWRRKILATIYSMKYYEVQVRLSRLTPMNQRDYHEPAVVLRTGSQVSGILKDAPIKTATLQRARLAG